jgi:hypothetical protein
MNENTVPLTDAEAEVEMAILEELAADMPPIIKLDRTRPMNDIATLIAIGLGTYLTYKITQTAVEMYRAKRTARDIRKAKADRLAANDNQTPLFDSQD